MSTFKSNMKTGEDIVKALAETSQKDNEVGRIFFCKERKTNQGQR